jgi:hypothetical protein
MASADAFKSGVTDTGGSIDGIDGELETPTGIGLSEWMWEFERDPTRIDAVDEEAFSGVLACGGAGQHVE